jgi:aminoglycoside 3-N-acetyltransferase
MVVRMRFLTDILKSWLTPQQRSILRARYARIRGAKSDQPHKPRRGLGPHYLKVKRWVVNHFLSYGSDELRGCLGSLGIREGDTILCHSSFSPFSGFQGSVREIIDVLQQAVGERGNVMMVSMPYTTNTYEYLDKVKSFDIRKAPSRMGLISESFRRQKGVLRSLHPTHPVLAAGPKAPWIVADHEKALSPCGPGTPFEKLALLEGKVIFLNVRLTETFTFIHYLEDRIKDKLPFPLYFDEPFTVPVRDFEGREHIVKTNAFSPAAIERRWPEILEKELDKRNSIRRARIGNSKLLLVTTRDAIECVDEMTRGGRFFYNLS